ncbi:mediator of RNA polymerase II transcription subunit 7 [Paecilomyces variotii No. 5]|uniref:Mediator of RNA polymerase II transcription subunit 7 n=1 Tax=Byssochlamys spectabilis (strain No. 5 / NBRC 109023) TaxID=1356009 RepID=V5FZS6_BYSSN|nr:mediator of RNA polymerase II transcription subunit 7 [Paecilomyces variotii No. 5]
MADAAQQRALTAAFPPPPPFWKHFTPDNLQKFEEIKQEARGGENSKKNKKWTPAELQALQVPPELRFLVPPQVPGNGHYSVFGELQSLSTTLPSLKEQGIEQLYPSPPATEADDEQSQLRPARPLNHAYYLLKISKSLLLNFLEFIGILSVAPEQFEPKLEDMRNLFVNAHHLLNLYRPHQARESLILMMEEQLHKTKEEIEEIDQVKTKVETILQQLKNEGNDADTASRSSRNRSEADKELNKKAVEYAQQIWELLDDEIGTD